ncbi:SOS response-associated peptidase family protein [Bosea sp. 685]|uniref:SOS response-associated peptidase family protein n=1 Tax=Bosea sp. 685 TaxID=3080057 RepID=UPI003977B9BD
MRRRLGSTFNARIEGAATSPMFRSAWDKRRCIIPASAFYEWTGPKGERIPHRISTADGGLMAFGDGSAQGFRGLAGWSGSSSRHRYRGPSDSVRRDDKRRVGMLFRDSGNRTIFRR